MRVYAALVFLWTASLPTPAVLRTLEEQEQSRAIERALGALDQAMTSIDRASKEKKAHCLSVATNERYCDCVIGNITAIISFLDYITIVTQSKQELQYDQRKSDDKKIIDATRHARDVCANAQR